MTKLWTKLPLTKNNKHKKIAVLGGKGGYFITFLSESWNKKWTGQVCVEKVKPHSRYAFTHFYINEKRTVFTPFVFTYELFVCVAVFCWDVFDFSSSSLSSSSKGFIISKTRIRKVESGNAACTMIIKSRICCKLKCTLLQLGPSSTILFIIIISPRWGTVITMIASAAHRINSVARTVLKGRQTWYNITNPAKVSA